MDSTINFIMELCKRDSMEIHKQGEHFSKAIFQNTSKQDACGFIVGDEFSILWCSDSHGGSIDKKKFVIRDFFNNLSDEQWIIYLSQENFYLDTRDEHGEYISQLFKDIDQTKFIDTGATLSIVKIFPDRFECYRVGDSPIYIWRDAENILYSDHDNEKKEDIKQLKKRKYFKQNLSKNNKEKGIIDNQDIYPLSSDKITSISSYYIMWDSPCYLNMSRSIGHNSLQGFSERQDKAKKNNETIELSLPKWEMTKHVIQRVPESKERVIIATDGISTVTGTFDFSLMYNISAAHKIIYFAYKRWNQIWTYSFPGTEDSKERIPIWNRDDMAVVLWNN